MKQIYNEEYVNIHIKWHRPLLIETAWDELNKIEHENIYLYKILGMKGSEIRLLYIGVTLKQEIHNRLINGDHLIKKHKLRKDNPSFELYVSAGEFIQKEQDTKHLKWAQKHAKTIEHILIFAHCNNGCLTNKKNINWFNTLHYINIYNSGYKKDGMFSKISFGLTVK